MDLLFAGSDSLRFSLGGTIYFNNSVISITDVGTEGTTTPLVCITDFRPCCRGQFAGSQPILGEWHYPNGTMVPGNGPTEGKFYFFRTRGINDGTVNLYRRNSGVTSPSGSYCCEIPDTNMDNQILCANLGKKGFLHHYDIVLSDHSCNKCCNQIGQQQGSICNRIPVSVIVPLQEFNRIPIASCCLI